MPDAVKAAHYIQLLDDARCEENWDAVPELVRKVRKHAPDRACLTLTAETEHGLTLGSQGPTLSTAEGATAQPTLSFDAAAQASKLIAVIDANTQFPQERFQAQVCLGWLHWVVKEYDQALLRLPKTFDLEYPQYEDLEGLTEWTKVCALKSPYLKVNCLMRNGQQDEAIEVFDTSIPSLTNVWVTLPARQQLRYWSELFLTEACMLSSSAIHSQQKSLNEPNCLACFRAWAKYWAAAKGTGLGAGYGFKGSVPRRQVWAEYYAVISQILQDDLPFPTGFAVLNNESSARNQLRAELKKVEIIYQGMLYSETRFPKADEERKEVEDFVDRLMQNWAILSGRGWREQDLGHGGREALSRGVLDSLYGAAMKTYHSTAVLRHLFIVHLAVAEFDLAFKSFDSYFELVKKGKARVEKTGHHEPSLDDDATVLEVVSACIAALCRYGDRAAAEKAKGLASDLEQWLGKLGQSISGQEHDDGISPVREDGPVVTYPDKIPPNIFALSWQSIGLAYAQWARMTYDSESRAQIQDKAIQYLRRSLSPEFGHAADIRGVFALGLLYAEQRKLAIAIELVKTALLADSAPEENQELYNGPYWRERALIPLWHLLALMLSARQEYFLAARACEGAIEQFRDPVVLFGGRHLNSPYRSDHLNEVEAGGERESEGLVDEMDDYEKESILEIKMTQLAILEVVEGPAVAVNASRELLALFPRLFSGGERLQEPQSTADPPKTAAGTLRSFRQSVFGARSVRSGRSGHMARDSVLTERGPPTLRPQTTYTTASTIAPTIQVTNERGDVHTSRRSRKSGSVSRRSESGRRNSLKKRDSSGSRRRAVSSSGVRDSETFFSPFQDLDLPQYFTFASRNASSASSHGQHHSHSHSAAQSQASIASEDLAGISVNEVETFAALLPRVQFPQDHVKRRRGGLLLRVWLLIAGFYRRAGRFDNAQEACAEALRLVQGLESDISKDTTGSLSLRHAMWGERKSIQELLADIWAERGYLSVAKEDPYLARSEFESALIHFADHPSAIVGLADILLDVYTEKLPPAPTLPNLGATSGLTAPSDVTSLVHSTSSLTIGTRPVKESSALPVTPLGLAGGNASEEDEQNADIRAMNGNGNANGNGDGNGHARSSIPSPPPPRQHSGGSSPTLPPPHKATSLLLADRLAARDRAYGLLSGLTKLGAGWNYSEAWFVLARAYEASGQPDKAKDVLWWCVELEDGVGVRSWNSVGSGGYVL